MVNAARAEAPAPVVVWRPRSKPQEALIACPVFEVFFGGSRGSLKTDGVLGDWINHSHLHGKNAIGIMLRRTREELMETYERAKTIFVPLGFKFNEQQHTCTAPNGSRLRFAYLERDADAGRYQGHSYTRVYIEEIGNFPDPGPVMKMMATLRSSHGVPCGFRATGNPGGPGHQWVRARYIDPAPLGWQVIKTEFVNPWTQEKITKDRVFIPGKMTDHNLLGAEYVANLQMSGSPELVRAWLEGDWSVITGAYFPEFSVLRHVVAPRSLPKGWTRFRSFDWGSASPFSVGWYAVSDGTLPEFPKGAIIKYREWYGMAEGQPNTGLKLRNEDIGIGIAQREHDEDVAYGVADPSAFAEDGGPSHMETITRAGAKKWRPADNSRPAGWGQVRSRLVGQDGRPMIFFFSTCVHTIRTLPALQHDANKPEDVDSDSEDHAGDETRYACMSRPYARPAPPVKPPIAGDNQVVVTPPWDKPAKQPWQRRQARA